MSFRVVVKRKRPWVGLGMVAFYTLFLAIGMYGTIRVECARSDRGQPARCSGRTTRLYWSNYDLPPFTLERDGFRLGQSEPNSRNYRYPTLIAPTGTLESHAALDPPLAARVIAETNAFFENKEAREWQVAASTWKTSSVILLVGGALFGLLVLICRWRAVTIVIDPRGGFIERKSEVWQISEISSVYQRDSVRDGSSIELWMKDDVRPMVVEGGEKKSTTDATRAIERAIKERPS